MKTKLLPVIAIAALLFTSSVSAETSLVLDVSFGIRFVPPSRVTVPTGERVSVTAPSLGEDAQWHKNNLPIPGATNRTLVIEAAAPTDSGSYTYGHSQTLVLN